MKLQNEALKQVNGGQHEHIGECPLCHHGELRWIYSNPGLRREYFVCTGCGKKVTLFQQDHSYKEGWIID